MNRVVLLCYHSGTIRGSQHLLFNIMINWNQLLENLQWAGLGITQAATFAGVPASHLSDIAKGKVEEPPFSTGIKLLDLHLDACPNKHKQLLEE